jgi:hypothetical protein
MKMNLERICGEDCTSGFRESPFYSFLDSSALY